MRIKFRISDFGFRINRRGGRVSCSPVRNPQSAIRNFTAFSLVELLVVMTLLSLIVLALMAVFSSTQQAFRSSVTQTDILEGSRSTVDLLTTDLRSATHANDYTPSAGTTNFIAPAIPNFTSAVNFFVTNNDYQYSPLRQSLPGGSMLRTNLLQWFFVLGRENTKWTGAGYIVNSGSASPLYPLYRFYGETNISANPRSLFNLFQFRIYNSQWTNMSHVMDGVVHFVVRAYDTNGMWLTNGYSFGNRRTFKSAWFSAPQWGEVGFTMYSNMTPAAVELQLGVLEDRTLARAESLPVGNARNNYLLQQSGKLHLFRQRVNIPNVDPTAYQ